MDTRLTTGMLTLKRRKIALALILAPELTQAELERGKAEMAKLTTEINEHLHKAPDEQPDRSVDV